jgi:hypothetical protein
MDVKHGVLGGRYGVPIDGSLDEVEFVLEARATIELRLLDGEVPLEGVALRLETAAGVTLGDAQPTDPDGRVRFGPFGKGRYRFSCLREDCWPGFVEVDVADEEEIARDIQVRQLADMELELRDREGRPAAGVPVELRSIEFGADVARWIEDGKVRAPGGLVTGADGRLRLQGLPRGAYSWTIRGAEGPVAGAFELAPGDNTQRLALL